ncbi:hypothetical protein OOT46_00190 [Aquabacterium sp. A7-Y]|uniref:exodeoxyribonuclease VII large subunit n=1 Tax=Aquabacterium sp. A7-Y TaxID=1349605 RepID=UPI00223E87F6|nr:exodeoxyribonuclease VII large subunit [Aquabacterium sp. A7-Y]MCW7536272.1 hypothetical protein [Aquabacterium sp. A7-Y]
MPTFEAKAGDGPTRERLSFRARHRPQEEPQEGPLDSRNPFTPASLNVLHKELWETGVRPYIEDLGWLVSVKGRLWVPGADETHYERHYKVPLELDGETTYVSVGKKLISARNIQAGDFVVATGRIAASSYKGEMQVRLDVVDVQRAESPEEAERRHEEELTFSAAKALGVRRYPFPLKERLTISLICSPSSQVREDFVRALGPALDYIDMEHLSAAMNDARAIAKKIDAATGDIIALARGGGAVEELALLNSRSLAEALARKNAFRIVGLGHSGDSSLLDYVVDYAADTPTSAGFFIRDQLAAFIEMREAHQRHTLRETQAVAENAQARVDAYAEDLKVSAQAQSAMQGRLDELQQQLERWKGEVRQQKSESQKASQSTAVLAKLLLAALSVILLLSFGLYLKH